MEALEQYFTLFDASRTDQEARNQLLKLFTADADIVLNGVHKVGFEGFITMFYEHNSDIKHMWDSWELQEDGSYHANWAVCGKTTSGQVYAKTGIDIAKLNETGQIIYLENVQEDKSAFQKYE